MLWAVSQAPLEKLQAYKQRMGWTFPWASSHGGDFNVDFNVSITEEQQREGSIEYHYERGGHALDATEIPLPDATYSRERPGMSAFALEDGVVYHTFHLRARTGQPLGQVPVARSRSEGTQRTRPQRLVAPLRDEYDSSRGKER
jgi:predicted dithiol-disulfide oxidoreductase (DUF899 family)